MSWFIRSHGRLLRQVCGQARSQLVRQQLKYSQQNIPEPVISRKKKYLYTAFMGASLIGFGYYVNKEREYGKFKLFISAIMMIFGKSCCIQACNNYLTA